MLSAQSDTSQLIMLQVRKTNMKNSMLLKRIGHVGEQILGNVLGKAE